MRIAVLAIIGIHALIHLFGFLKAFGFAEFTAISQPISKPLGLVWLVACLIFTFSILLYLTSSDYWWISGFIAVIISQVLILLYWSDAKYGTIANSLILIAIIIAYGNYSFSKRIATERHTLLQQAEYGKEQILSIKNTFNLPSCVQKWLKNSGVIGKPIAQHVYLEQDLKLKLNTEQKDWNTGKAVQYFTSNPPAFHWSITTKMNGLLPVVGRDKFENGSGAMLIKLLALIPVANAQGSTNIDQATLQRYLAEIVWFPSAALSPYITWESLNENSARATMVYNGTEGSGVFHFDAEGNFKKFECMRYKDASDKTPTKWTVKAVKIEERSGVRIPVECEAIWDINGEDWKWLKLKIKDVDYNEPLGI